MEAGKDLGQSEYFLIGKIEKFEDKMAIITTSDGYNFSWPIKKLPDDLQVGSEVKIKLSTSRTEEAESEMIAKNVLNEILKNSDT